MSVPAVSFRHLARMTDGVGLLEHAEGIQPRYEHGYCVDDVARALVLVSREREPTDEVVVLARRYLYFLVQAQASDGRTHNRLGYDRHWGDLPNVEDCWGRAIWAFGTAAVHGATLDIREQARTAFDVALRTRSPYPQAMAFAALGAVALLDGLPGHAGALALLSDATAVIGRPSSNPSWPWPLPRLSYANAAIAEAIMAAGAKLGDEQLKRDGLRMLAWLLDIETATGHLSLTPVGGRGPAGATRVFDQQPIEAAALADACVYAATLDDDPRWMAGLQLCIGWFLGDNDSKTPMFDAVSGGGCDGLMAGGRNRNQGAESTMALMAVLQHAQHVSLAAR
jgi:hypothetical protein